MEAIRERGVQLLSLVLLVMAWAVISLVVGEKIVPSPIDVFPLSWEMIVSGAFIEPLWASLFRLLLGFILASTLGIIVGIASAQLLRLGIAAAAMLTIIMTTPTLVIIFVAMIMMGQNDFTVILVTGIIVFPFMAVPLRDTMKEMDRDIIDMANSFKVSTPRKVMEIYIPYLVPSILATARIGFSLSWKVVVLAEVFGFTSGIGWQISLNYFQYDLTALIAWLVVFVVVILFIEQMIRSGERAVVKWKE